MMVALVAVGVITAFRAVLVEIPQGFDSAFTALQVPEAGIQDVVFIGVGLAFLVIMILDADR